MIFRKYTVADDIVKGRIAVVDSFQESSLMVLVNIGENLSIHAQTNLASDFQTFGSNLFH